MEHVVGVIMNVVVQARGWQTEKGRRKSDKSCRVHCLSPARHTAFYIAKEIQWQATSEGGKYTHTLSIDDCRDILDSVSNRYRIF